MRKTEVILPDYDEMMERLSLVSDDHTDTEIVFPMICGELAGRSFTPNQVVAELEKAISRYCEEWHTPPEAWEAIMSSFKEYLRVLITDVRLRKQARQYFELAA